MLIIGCDFHTRYQQIAMLNDGRWRIERLGAASLCRLHQQRVRFVPVFDACTCPPTCVLRS